MKRLTIIVLALSFVYFVLSTVQAMAVSSSDFPVCSNPQGTVVASYADGVHGIAGDVTSHTGADTVYSVSNDMNVQCFCPADSGADGIQTNWIKASSLSQSEVSVLEHDGWIYIPSGANWGLADDPYLAKNMSYTCKGSSNGSSGSSSSSSTSNGSSNGVSSGVVEAAGAILGFANTGNTITLLSIALIGLVAFFLSFFLRKTK